MRDRFGEFILNDAVLISSEMEVLQGYYGDSTGLIVLSRRPRKNRTICSSSVFTECTIKALDEIMRIAQSTVSTPRPGVLCCHRTIGVRTSGSNIPRARRCKPSWYK